MAGAQSLNTLATDPAYVAYQYADSEKLRIRIETHARYTVGESDFEVAELTHLAPQAGLRLLDVGCGTNRLQHQLTPLGVAVVGLDQSAGLLAEARRCAPDATLVHGDATALPFADAQFDRVCALGVLYHVRDWPTALREMRRVVSPGGRVVCSTNGPDALQRILDLHQDAARAAGYTPLEVRSSAFHLGHLAEVREVFPTAQVHVLESALEFSEVEPALRFYATNRIDLIKDRPADGCHRPVLAAHMRELIEGIIAREGVFRVPKSFGFFVADLTP